MPRGNKKIKQNKSKFIYYYQSSRKQMIIHWALKLQVNKKQQQHKSYSRHIPNSYDPLHWNIEIELDSQQYLEHGLHNL